MLAPNDFRKCVAYLTVDAADKETGGIVRQAMGTAFFVSVPVDIGQDVQGTIAYLVTARHLVDASRAFSRMYARVNLPNGGFLDIPLAHADKWEMHPTTDVAALTVSVDHEKLDVKSIPRDGFLSEKRIAEAKNPPGEGDEVVLVGLFTSHPGSSRSEPVVRFGHIARMPYERIPIKMDPAPTGGYKPVNAYLAEATSYGGQSGSPAFVYFAPDRVPGSISVGGPMGGGFALLGLVHGHYPNKQKVEVTSGDVTGEGEIDFNLGISVVIPAQDILDVLDSEVFVKNRRISVEAHLTKNAPIPDIAVAVQGEGNAEFERFEALTQKLVNTPKPKPESKGEAN